MFLGEYLKHFWSSYPITISYLYDKVSRIKDAMSHIYPKLQIDSSDIWEPTTFILNHSNHQVTIDSKKVMVIEENYSADLFIKIPFGLSGQFVLMCSNGTSHPFSTNNDVSCQDLQVRSLSSEQNQNLPVIEKLGANLPLYEAAAALAVAVESSTWVEGKWSGQGCRATWEEYLGSA
ncbi:hypothetical protein NE237_028982 [Protea cynaroides]|uniref:DUF7046 domain-containing protein n=1 Tax=Protea cynaroides TaxID=273540 RepID=A0A9Q0GTG6_9MAGN|nr:hypothetical protein NE237_028982 [Protea cynaroides]